MSKILEIPFSDLRVSDVIVGKGAFGEVRVASWRGTAVAYKMVHAQTQLQQEHKQEEEEGPGVDSFQHEIEILSELRHPNLVLFLGVCRDNKAAAAIVTELLSCSLYDILEGKKIKLSLPDILDLCIDIANGLHYLHAHSPAIVHRDISAKNILISGNHAKIADLGQAKLFAQSTLSRQTGLPGAMAYAAPEVLTGKYSSKIDIFSFGVLLAEMVTGEYPRVDRREEQFSAAQGVYECLSKLLKDSTSFHPEHRPTAAEMTAILTTLRENDRYYPISRRNSPEKEIGVEGRWWMREKSESTLSELSLRLEQTTKQLRAEEGRLRVEASRVDALQAQVQQLQAAKEETEKALAAAEADKETLRAKLLAMTRQCEDVKDQLKLVSLDLQRSSGRCQTLENQLASKAQENKTLSEENVQSRIQLKNMSDLLRQGDDQSQQLHRRMEVISRQLQIQVDYGKDLEARLEQALSRWKQEKEQFSTERNALAKANRQCASLVEKLEVLKKEREESASRLKQYEGLPLPEEIKSRLLDLDRDKSQLQLRLQQIELQWEALREEKAELDAALSQSRSKEQEQEQISETLKHKVQTMEAQVMELTRYREEQNVRIVQLEKVCAEKESDLKTAYNEIDKCRDSIDSLSLALSDAQMQQQGQPAGGASAESRSLPVPTITVADPPVSTADPQTVASSAPADRISDIAVKHQVERAMGRAGALGLLNLLKSSHEDERVVWRCLRSLRELVLHEESSRAQCLASAPEQWLMPLMSRFLSVAVLQAQAARLLGTLSFGNDTFRRYAGEQKAMERLSEALDVHTEDETVVLHVFTAVTNLAHGSYENRCRLRDCGGVTLLVKAMDLHKAAVKLQCQGCWALLTLSGSEGVAEAVAEAQGHRVVVQALTLHSLDGGVQQYGCWALRNLALAGDSIARVVKAQGAAELCRIAMENHANNAEVLKQARETLAICLSSTEASSPSPPPPAGNGSSLRGSSSAPSFLPQLPKAKNPYASTQRK